MPAVILARIERAIGAALDPLLAVVRVAVIALAAGIVLVTFVQVVRRYVFNDAFFGAEELARFMFTWLIFLGGTIALDRGMHFAVDVLVNVLPSLVQRAVFVLVQAIVLAVLAILLVKGVQLTALNWRQLSPALQIPISFPYAAIPTASALMILVVLRRLCRGVSRPAPFLPEQA
jgi:TRAP-type C4-dicarboxylate transport system permease small subunit